MSIQPMNAVPTSAGPTDQIRQGPLCRTCPASITGRPCTDCSLRAGVHTHSFPSTALLPKEPPRWAIFAVVGSLLTLFVLGSFLTAVDRTVFSAENAVDDFFAALRDRDGAAAIAQTEANAGLLSTAAMIKDSGYQPPTKWKATVVDGGFRAATIDVTYTIENRELKQELQLERIGYRAGIFSRWSIGGTQPTLDVVMPDTGLVVAGETIPSTVALRTSAVLPGAYMVQTPKNPLLTLNTQVVALPEADRSDSPTVTEISSGAKGQAKKALTSLLQKCEGSIELAPAGCPFRGNPSCSESDPVTWKVGKLPVLTLSQGPAENQAGAETTHSTIYLEGDTAGYMRFTAYCGFGPQESQTQIDVTGWALSWSEGKTVLTQPQASD
jgi:hypothetical protein